MFTILAAPYAKTVHAGGVGNCAARDRVRGNLTVRHELDDIMAVETYLSGERIKACGNCLKAVRAEVQREKDHLDRVAASMEPATERHDLGYVHPVMDAPAPKPLTQADLDAMFEVPEAPRYVAEFPAAGKNWIRDTRTGESVYSAHSRYAVTAVLDDLNSGKCYVGQGGMITVTPKPGTATHASLTDGDQQDSPGIPADGTVTDVVRTGDQDEITLTTVVGYDGSGRVSLSVFAEGGDVVGTETVYQGAGALEARAARAAWIQRRKDAGTDGLKAQIELLETQLATLKGELSERQAAEPVIEKHAITGWPIFTVGAARYRYAVSPRIQGPFGGMDYVKYFHVDGLYGQSDQRKAYPDAATDSVQGRLWQARYDFDLARQVSREAAAAPKPVVHGNGPRTVVVGGIAYVVRSAVDSDGQPFLWYTAGGNAPRMSCNAYSPVGSVQRQVWDASH